MINNTMIILKIILYLFICLVTFLFLIYIKQKINWNGFRDWKEFIPYYRRKIDMAGEEALKIMEESGKRYGIGSCHTYWGLKQDILKKKYKINWKSPADLNPWRIYD
jgi:hypothetical protein